MDNRGISELIGTVLLVSFVIMGATVVIGTGLPTIIQIQGEQQEVATTNALQELDERLKSLAASEDAAQTSIEFDEMTRGSVALKEDDGYLEMTVNKRSSCRVNLSLDSLQYTNTDDETIAYQGGGVWRQYPGGRATMITAPDVEFRNGTINVQLQNISGTFDKGKNVITHDIDGTRSNSRYYTSQLVTGPCKRPDNITFEVHSRYGSAWKRYLQDETGVADSRITRIDSETYRVTVPQSKLPARMDDERNDVVNLSENPPAYMDSTQWSPGGNTISVDKNADNTYTTYVTPLASWRPDVGRIRTFGDEVTVQNRAERRVTLVIDRSGSMGWHHKNQHAREAAKVFVETLNLTAGDQAAILTYNGYAHYKPVDGQYFSKDATALNDTIDTIPANGGTNMNRGMRHASALLDLNSSRNVHDKNIVFLTDGRNNPWVSDQAFLDYAATATRAGSTIYTISVGPGASRGLLEDAAESRSDGEHYHVTNSKDLKEVFKQISNTISNQKEAIALDPISTSVTIGGNVVDTPQIPGDTDHVAANTSGGNRFLNVNDPTAPAQFSHAFGLDDGEDATINGRDYTCNKWISTGISRLNTSSGERYPVVTCANMTNGSELSPSKVRIIRKESELRNLATNDASAWWQPSTGSILNESQVYNETTDSYELLSNQAIVELSFDNTGPADPNNKLLLLVQVGLSEERTTGEELLNVKESELHIGD